MDDSKVAFWVGYIGGVILGAVLALGWVYCGELKTAFELAWSRAKVIRHAPVRVTTDRWWTDGTLDDAWFDPNGPEDVECPTCGCRPQSHGW